jgi:hypothetical protein
MYDNFESEGVAKQQKLYNQNGRDIIQVYVEGKKNGQTRAEIIAGMGAKIDEIVKIDPTAFKHSQPLSKLNTVDISPAR